MYVEYIWVWISLLFGTTKGNTVCKDFKYLKCLKDKALIGHVIRSFYASSVDKCQHSCYVQTGCVSYNLGPVTGAIRWCELNRYDHSTSPALLKISDKSGYEYCPIKNPCSSNPCIATKLCKPSLDWSSFICREGVWGSWGAWVQCPCPKRRKRACRNPLTNGEASDCPGSNEETKPCLYTSAFPNEACSSPLGMFDRSIPDANIHASSYYTWMDSCKPKHGRLHDCSRWAAGWCAKTLWPLGGQYLQIDLGVAKKITKVATQGRHGVTQYVTRYSLSYSNDTVTWFEYSEKGLMGIRKVFIGNSNPRSVVANDIAVPFKARHIRVIPWGYIGWISMRIELYGC